MIVIPAIDLRGGRCVRLVQGRFEEEIIFSDDPVAMARHWVAEGARRLHVVDLDGACAGHLVHGPLIAQMACDAGVPVQMGGGIRTIQAVQALLGLGVRWAILGTGAALDEDLVARACERFPGQILVGVDARDGRVAIKGWKEILPETAESFARRMGRLGVAALIHTDISRDGTRAGPSLEAIRGVARVAGVPVIASGGIGSLDDLRALQHLEPEGIMGAIVGRALYTGEMKLAEALALVGTA